MEPSTSAIHVSTPCTLSMTKKKPCVVRIWGAKKPHDRWKRGGGGAATGGEEGRERVRFRGKMKVGIKIISERRDSPTSDGEGRWPIGGLAWLGLGYTDSRNCSQQPLQLLTVTATATATATVTVNQLKDIDRVQAFLSRARMSPVVERDMGIGNI